MIAASSVLGKHTLAVARNEKGFLDTVSFDRDGSGIGKLLARTVASARAAGADAAAARAKEDAATEKAVAGRERAVLAAADKARREAQLECCGWSCEPGRSSVPAPQASPICCL